MVRKRSSQQGAIVGTAIVAALLLSAGVYWVTRPARHANEGVAPTIEGLPQGVLAPSGATVTEVRYVVMDNLQAASALVLIVGKTPTSVEQRYPLAVKREAINCANRTIANEAVSLYDQDGKLAASQYEAGSVGRSAESADSEMMIVCDHTNPPAWRIVKGWRRAQRAVQLPPADIDARIKAKPDDAELLAWRCHSVALGHWRADGRQVCDKAVVLAPEDISVRLDRGFLALMLGDRKAAVRDFDDLLSKAADNAPALFGRGLVEAMNGGASASKADRAKALKVDPKVPDWIQQTYGINISPQYLTA